jgi:DNA repair exonuclease SbcCD ATPase subunit
VRFNSIKVRDVGVLRDVFIDFSAIGGQVVAVCGANGSGKTTLLEVLAGSIYRSCPTRGKLIELASSRDSLVEVSVDYGETYTISHRLDALSKKSEALVTDVVGTPVVSSTKVRDVDSWAAEHLPSQEVLYSSIFAAQGSGGFIDLKEGDRKAVLLRVLGVEHLEQKAEAARAKARDAKRDAELAAARLGELSAVDVAEAERAHVEALAACATAEERHARRACRGRVARRRRGDRPHHLVPAATALAVLRVHPARPEFAVHLAVPCHAGLLTRRARARWRRPWRPGCRD